MTGRDGRGMLPASSGGPRDLGKRGRRTWRCRRCACGVGEPNGIGRLRRRRLWPRRAPSQVALCCKRAALAQVARRLRAGRAGSERRAGAPMGTACLQIW